MTDKVQEFLHQHVTTFGIGRDLDEASWRAVFRQLLARGALRVSPEGHGGLELSETAKPILRGEVPLFRRARIEKFHYHDKNAEFDTPSRPPVMASLAPVPQAARRRAERASLRDLRRCHAQGNSALQTSRPLRSWADSPAWAIASWKSTAMPSCRPSARIHDSRQATAPSKQIANSTNICTPPTTVTSTSQ